MKIQESLGFLLNVNARLIKRKFDSKIKENHLTAPQWSVLKLLSVENDLTQVEIANRLCSDIVTAGSVTDRLAQKDLLQKRHLNNDRRAYVVSILDGDRNIVELIEKDAIQCSQDAL
jgi:DNA-binding MarR family transcriptional regulator